MNPSEVLRRLWKEKHEWEAMDYKTPEIEWTLRGINLCVNHVKDIVQEQRTKERLKHPKVDHQHATKLYHAIKGALHQLKISNHKSAAKIMTHILEIVPVGYHGK